MCNAIHPQASPVVSVLGGGAGGQSPDDHRYVDMMSLQLPSSLELGSSLRGALPSDLDLNAADQHVGHHPHPLRALTRTTLSARRHFCKPCEPMCPWQCQRLLRQRSAGRQDHTLCAVAVQLNLRRFSTSRGTISAGLKLK